MENVKPREVSKEAVRRFLVSRQGFLRGVRGKEGTLETIKRLECIQTDPINAVHHNQHIVLHNRVTDYELSYLDELLYKERLVFEYWCNERSIIPIEDFPYFRYRMQNPSEFHSPFFESIKAKRAELKDAISYVLTEITKYGAHSTRDFKKKGKITGKVTTQVLNLLWDCGDLMIHHTQEKRRYYDLAERLLSANLDMELPSREEYVEFMVQKYMRAYGLIDTRNWRFGWLPLNAAQKRAIVEDMIKSGKLYPIKVEDVKHVYYVLEEDLGLLEGSDESISEEVHFVAPLDNLLWNRRMISEVFDFNYAWEVYKPPEKRIYGYYVMPILHDTHFVGRLDPKLDRRNGEMILNTLLLEDGDIDENLMGKLASALQRFLEFHNVSQFSIEKTQPRGLRDALTRELS